LLGAREIPESNAYVRGVAIALTGTREVDSLCNQAPDHRRVCVVGELREELRRAPQRLTTLALGVQRLDRYRV
jgi:hypothetical protein